MDICQQEKFLEHVAYNLRVLSLIMTTQAGSGHVTSCLSAADIVATIFFYAMQFDPNDDHNPNNDRFILSKGHAAPILYAVWKQLGILKKEDLLTYRSIESTLEGHPTARFSRFEAATGSLGQGLSIAAGMAYAARMDNRSFYTYCLLGDSESTEGSVWEAAEIAAHYRLNNLIAVLDCNRLGQSTATIHEYHLNCYAAKFSAFGWQPCIVDGHNIKELMSIFDQAKKSNEKPVIIIAKTIKGFGVGQAEDKQGYHGKAFADQELPHILADLEKRFLAAASYAEKSLHIPIIPPADIEQHHIPIVLPNPHYNLDQMVATRKAYGQTLAIMGGYDHKIVSLDAEVKNSTYAELFEEKYPDRFVQCFVAEQNMLGMAVGMAARGKIPFVSTFGVFFTRAFDQIRMAAIGRSPLRLVGSHAGISIGQDGPSQMALEDIALMRTLPQSIILYPSDAVSTYRLTQCMANYQDGISYLRTTRMQTPVIYAQNESFFIGGCKVLKQSVHDQACIVGAGITLHEALKAYEILKQENIMVTVIDLYSIKPFDEPTVISVAQKANKNIITVEDHYVEGGLGEMVRAALVNTGITIKSLSVKKLPRSGTPEELLAWASIDAHAIVDAVRSIV